MLSVGMTVVPKALSIDGAFALASLFSIALSAFAKEKGQSLGTKVSLPEVGRNES